MSIRYLSDPNLGLLFVYMSMAILFLCPVSISAQFDIDTMQQVKQSMKLPLGVDWSNSDPCKWKHIVCDSQRVTRIQLGSLGISGFLSPAIGNLTNLEVLELMNNNLSGALPSLEGLNSLKIINLNDNQFELIPPNFFNGLTSLQVVFLDKNPFSTWHVPDGLKNASSLVNFSANSANITGKIPEFFNSDTFPSLTHLHMSFNNLQDSLPSGFSGLALQSLRLNGQRDKSGARNLKGTIGVLQNMTQLVQIWLNMNDFTGPIPDLSRLKNLEDLNLRDNSLTGPVPDSLLRITSLKVVNLTNNAIQGPTPKFLASVVVDILPNQNSFCLPDPGVECDSRVQVLISVSGSFGYPLKLAKGWKGNNPCYFTGITCAQGNITVVNLQNMDLNGTISPKFAYLTSLEMLYLAHNNIRGTIPDALATMPNLTILDLSFNQLYGKMPRFTHTTVDIKGNAHFGKETRISGGGGTSKKSSKTEKIVGGVIAAIGVTFLGSLFLCCFMKRKRLYGRVQQSDRVLMYPNHYESYDGVNITVNGRGISGKALSEDYYHGRSDSSDVHVIETNSMVISIQVLRSVTNNFSDEKVLGKGGFGTVYKGELPDGTKIAVKRMNSGILGDKGLAEFKSEIAVLTRVRHRHLVALLGFCLDGNEKLLVYEYLPQGALSEHLFSWKEEGLKPLSWKQRLTIALDVARGVEYLHSLAHQSFIHRDLKPSNILLGDDMRAKVADFGLVRLAPDGGKTSIETRLAGTFGYLAPEYAVMGRITTKVDIFSFGVIVMEMITGRKALDQSQPEDSVHLVSCFRKMYTNKDTLQKAIDTAIDLDEETVASVNTVAQLAGHCCAREPYQRPEMGHVVNVLSSLSNKWKPAEENAKDMYEIDFDMTLPQTLKKWQALQDSNIYSYSSSSFIASGDNTQTSIPTRPSGFDDSFTSTDGR